MTRHGGNADGRSLAAVVLAAGAGTRLAPLTRVRPKALCPVGNRPLVDLALERVEAVVDDVAVNLHHGGALLRDHLDRTRPGAVHLSEEHPVALGTAGAIGALRGWLDGRDVLVVNADAWSPDGLAGFVARWDGRRPRVLVHRADAFGPRVGVVASLLPAHDAARLAARPTGLYEAVWRRYHEAGELETERHDGEFVDCGTPAAYLGANLRAAVLAGGTIVDPTADVGAGSLVGSAVVGEGAVVAGEVRDAVVWPGQEVAAGERLERSVRATASLTVGPLDAGTARPG